MTPNADAITLGLFEDEGQAQQAIEELRTAGLGGDHIHLAGHGTTPGSPLAGLRSLLTGHQAQASAPYDELVRLGLPEEEARFYQRQYEAGRSIVTVTAGSRLPQAADILARAGASVATRPADPTAAERPPLAQTTDATGTARIADTDATHTPGPVGTTRVAHSDTTHTPGPTGTTRVAHSDTTHTPGPAGTTRVAHTDATHAHDAAEEMGTADTEATPAADAAAGPPGAHEGAADTGGEQRLPLREERLEVRTHWVAASYVVIRKRVITEEKTFTVRVAREEVVIERYPPPAQAAGTALTHEQLTSQGEGQLLEVAVGQTIRIPLREEEVHLEKRPVVVEEVVIEKQALQETRQVSALVEREVPRLQRTGTAPLQDRSGTLREPVPAGETQADSLESPSTASEVTLVSVFQEAGRAHLAMAALQGAGIRPDQMQYSLAGVPANRFHDDLLALGLPQEVATAYSQVVEHGGTLVLVRASSRQQQDLLSLLRHCGASEATSAAQPLPTAPPPASTAGTAASGQPSLQLREERLHVHTQPVQVGQVQVGKNVVREQQTRQVPVIREEVVIERHAVAHQPSSTPIGPAQSYYLPLLAQDVQLEKRVVVGEELVVGKRLVHETEQVSETVQREEARIEHVGEATVHGDDVHEAPPPQPAS